MRKVTTIQSHTEKNEGGIKKILFCPITFEKKKIGFFVPFFFF